MPVELLTAFDWCWCHESLCRVLVRVWEFVGIFDHNNWIFFVVLYSCYLMGKMKSEANTLYELLLHFSMKNMRIVFNNIYSKKRAMRCFKMLFIIGVLGFLIMLGDFHVFSNTGFFICLMHLILTAIICCVIAINCCDWLM